MECRRGEERTDYFIGVIRTRNADISTFEGLCEGFLADPASGRRSRVFSAENHAVLTRIVRKEIVPAWGSRNSDSIQHWTKVIADGGRTERAVALPHMAMIYSWAVQREILQMVTIDAWRKLDIY